MEDIFKEARDRRRGKELILTSRMTNAFHYWSPVWADKKQIWPPMSEASSATNLDFEGQESTRHRISFASPKIPGDLRRLPLPSNVKDRLEYLANDRDTLYHPLHDGETIRILKLLPGKKGDPITCSFQYANLKYLHLQYQALSYVWGRDYLDSFDRETRKWISRVFTVCCNGHTMDVTPNLYSALEHIRERAKPLLIWADALCINQGDEQERGHQVTLMDAIYSHATRVHIWIADKDKTRMWDDAVRDAVAVPDEFTDVRAQRAFGAVCDIVNRWQGTGKDTPHATYTTHSPATPDVKQCFDTFEEVPVAARRYSNQDLIHKALAHHYPTRHNRPSRRGNTYNSEGDGDEEALTADLGIDSTPDHANDSQFWRSVGDLFDRSWFWRVWVVQEVVLAQSALVRWGNVEIDWKCIGLAAAILRTSYHDVCEKMQIGGMYNAYLMFRMSRVSDLPQPTLTFAELLRLTRQFDVTDPRDRVYGLLGMRAEGNDPDSRSLFLPVDYTISEQELWRRVAWRVIQTTGDLSILSSVQYSTGAAASEDALLARPLYWRWDAKRVKSDDTTPTPSWVPNWEHAYRVTLQPWDSQDAFAAAKEYPMKPIEDADTAPHVLRIEGIQVGTVGYSGMFMWHAVDTSLLRSQTLGAFFASEPGLRLLSQTYVAGRNAYGSLLEPKDDEPLADLAAYIISLNDCHREWSERNSQRLQRFGFKPNYRATPRRGLRQNPQSSSRSTSPSLRQSGSLDVSRNVSPMSNFRARSQSCSRSRSSRSPRSTSSDRSRAAPAGISGLFLSLMRFARGFRGSSKGSSRRRSSSGSRSNSRSIPLSTPRRNSSNRLRVLARLPPSPPSRGRTRTRSQSSSVDSKAQSDDEDYFETCAHLERGYAPLPRKDFNPVFKRHPNLQGQLRTWAARGKLSRFLETAISVCERRRLFITLNGFLGIGPDTVQEGDILAVLAGGDVPYLLRPIKQDTKLPSVGYALPCDPATRYLLVGECFVPGLMDGEAVDAANRESELLGPVPVDLTHQEIIDRGNQAEKVRRFAPIAEIERGERKKARLTQGLLFRHDMLAEGASPRLRKEEFHIW